MKTSGWVCTGMTAGALMMYMFDPQAGRKRRALLRDKLVHYTRLLSEGSEATWNDTRNRLLGLWVGFQSRLNPEREVSDTVLENRVRSRLGRTVSHPGWLDVRADHGAVKVAGHVPEREKEKLLATVVSIRGVRQVDEESLVVDPDDQVPLTGPRGTGYWAPAERFGAAVLGMSIGSYGMRRGGVTGGVMALTGLGLVLRGLINKRLTDLPGRLMEPGLTQEG